MTKCRQLPYDGAFVNGQKGPDYAVLRGIDTADQTKDGTKSAPQLELERTLIAGSLEEFFANSSAKQGSRPVVVGSELASRAGLKVGDEIKILAARNGNTFGGSLENHARVVGIFRSGLFEYDSTWVYFRLDPALFPSLEPHLMTVISVQVGNIYGVKEVGANVKAGGKGCTTVDWQEAMDRCSLRWR